MKKAIVTGANGQDGSYMTELLLGKGYRVLGTTRSFSSRDPVVVHRNFSSLQWDLCNEAVLDRALAQFEPDEIYNFAAFSSGARMFESPVAMGDINGLAVTRILSSIARSSRPVRFCQASSSEVFGQVSTSPQNEMTAPNPRTPYGSAKLYAESIVKVFRCAHGLYVCNATLFNHESPRRGPEFVTTKVVDTAARISLGERIPLTLGNLQARRDWGHARDYVEAMWLMLQQDVADDFVIATGQTHSIAELCDTAFSIVGLNYRDHVVVDPSFVRPVEAIQLVGDASKARRQLSWAPRTSFTELVTEMMEAALARPRT